jgi:hypothetical protein
MDILETLYNDAINRERKRDSLCEQASDRCSSLFEDISKNMVEEEKQKMISLSDTYIDAKYFECEESFREGFSTAVKMIFTGLLS